MKTTVIYHSADFDGVFCREIARKFLPDAELIGWDFGDRPLLAIFDPDTTYYVLDLPVDRVFGMDFKNTRDPDLWGWWDRVIWIDHHKSSIETHPSDIPGYRIDGVAACRLAWQWFNAVDRAKEGYSCVMLSKDVYVNRFVSEPWAVRLAGEYDIWDKRDSNAELFQHGLRSRELGPDTWDILLSGPTEPEGDKQGLAELYVETLLESGQAIQYATTQQNASIIKAAGFTVEFDGLKFLACNHARYNSHLFTAGLTPEHDACLGFAWRDGKWTVSLYHAPGKEHHDLSLIAVKHGGGGHRGACGFQAKTLPFLI